MLRDLRVPLCWILLASLCGSAFAQEASPATASPHPANGQASGEPSAFERMIYVPYRKLREVFENQKASVVLPYAEYLKLLERAGKPRPPAALDAVITQAGYVARVQGDLASVDATLSVQVTGKPWVRVPVAFGDAAIGKVSSPDSQVLLQGTGEGTYELWFSEPGAHTVSLELVARVRSSPQGRSLVLTTPKVGITTFELIIPRADQSVEITPQQVVLPQPTNGEQTHIKANVGSTGRIVASWTPRASSKPQMDLLTSVNNDLEIRIDEGLLHRTSKMSFDVLRGEMTELRFVVPAADRLLDVVSATGQVRKWTTEKQPNRQVVTVELLAPTEDDVVLEIHTEQSLPDGEIRIGGIDADGTVHGIHAQGVVRESGQLSVKSTGQLAINIITQERVVRTAQSANSYAWRYYGSNMNVTVAAEPIQPRVTAQQFARYIITDDNELRLNSTFSYQIERAGVFELVMSVPAGLQVDSVQGPHVADFNVSHQQLTVTLSDRKLGQLSFVVNAHQDFSAANAAATALPFLVAKNVVRESGTAVIEAPAYVEVITDEESVQGLFPDNIGPARQQATPTRRVASTWSWNRAPVAMSVRLQRKPTRLTARTDTSVDVQPKLITVATRVEFTVENAGIDTFRIAVPEPFADSVRFNSAQAPIKQQTREEEAVDGWVAWTIVLQQKVQGQLRLSAEYDITPSADDADADADADAADAGAAPGSIRTQIRPLQVRKAGPDASIEPVQVSGEVVITKDASLSVSATADGSDIEVIDVRELTHLPPQGARAFRFFRQDAIIHVNAVKYQIQPVVETVVARAGVEIVLAHDSMATYLCRYVIHSSERQRLRVDLPADAELLDQMVGGVRISLTPIDGGIARDGWQSFYANIGTALSGSHDNTSFTLTLHFRAPVTPRGSEPFAEYRGNQQLRLPRVGGDSKSVVTQELKVAVWVPTDYALVGHPQKFVREYESFFATAWPVRLVRKSGHEDLDQWLGDKNAGLVDFPREGHSYVYSSLGKSDVITVRWWDMRFTVWVISGAIFLIGFVLRKTPWENKLTIVLLAAFVGVLYALIDRETVMQSAWAGMYGLVAVALLWLIYAFPNRDKPNGSAPPPLPRETIAAGGEPMPGTSTPEPSGGDGAAPATDESQEGETHA